jgi:pyruvate,water dikinase
MEYEPVFKLPYSNVFITDLLFRGAYGKFNAIATIKNGKWELFLEKKLLWDLSETRFNEVLKGINFKEFEEKSMKLCKELTLLKDTKLENLSDKQFLEFLDKMFDSGGKFMENYSQTEFFFFKKIEQEIGEFIKDKFSFEDVLSNKVSLASWPEEKSKLADYIINMQSLKLELRKVLNEVWMGPASILAKSLEQLVIRTKRDDAVNLTLEEVKDLFQSKNVSNAQERHVYSYISWKEEAKKLIIFAGGEGYKKIRELDKQIPKNEVIGAVACKGFARGRAKIIPLSMNPEQYLSKMEKGDILVSDTTGPEMMVAIEKAAAIVTDEGGQISHAAIISREFNIPCIVGTSFATEVFKDGDLIEVNANNGIVRKIE